MKVWFFALVFVVGSVEAAQRKPPAPLEAIPKFGYVAEGWLPSTEVLVMDGYWANAGLLERGTHHWKAAGPKCERCKKWERYNPDSELFQSAFGVFVVKSFEFEDEWKDPSPKKVKKSARRVLEIAAATQATWLGKQGVESPKAQPVEGSVQVTEWSDGYLRVLGKVATQCDLGEKNPKRGSLPRFDEKLREKLDSYQPMELTYQALVKFLPDKKNLVVVYTALPTLTLKNDQVHTPSPRVAWDLARMANAVTF